MRLGDFINTYINTKVDYDRMYGAQCVDLFRQYCKDVLGIPHTGGVEGAKDLYLRYDTLPLERKYLEKIDIDKISCGDVIIWNSNENNKYGHVAIVVNKIENQVLVFEQDGFRQDGAKLKNRPLANALGALRLRG